MKPARYILAALLLSIALALGVSHLRADDKPAATDAKPDADGFVALFDGKTLDNWDGDPDLWSVKDGCITGETNADHKPKGNANTFLIYKGGEPADFELHAMFKLRNHNSGIQYRSKELGDHVISGYQADMDGVNRYTGILYEEKGRGILAERGQKVTIDASGKKTTEPLGDAKAIADAIHTNDWNDYVIIARGNHLTQSINGVTTVDVTDNETGKSAAEGVLALQIHQGPPMMVQFKDLQLKTLKAD